MFFFFFSNVDEKFLIMSLFEVYILVLINNLRTKKLYYTIVLKLIKAIIRRQYSILFLSLNFHSSAGLLKRTISFKLHFFKNNDTILFFFLNKFEHRLFINKFVLVRASIVENGSFTFSDRYFPCEFNKNQINGISFVKI